METIIRQFTNDTVSEIKSIPGGHINESFLVTGKKKYVLQRVNAFLYGNAQKELAANYLCYRDACRNAACDWDCPEWMTNRDGTFFYTDEVDKIWRMYEFIPGEIVTGKETETDAFALGEGLGRLHGILKTIPEGQITGVLPHLHDFKYYYDAFSKYDSDKAGNAPGTSGRESGDGTFGTERDYELEQIIRSAAEGMIHADTPRRGIIHADAKAGNMVFRGGQVVAFIDLDTMMEGSVFDDLADCMRASCVDQNATLMYDRIRDVLDGYEEGAKVRFDAGEREYAVTNLRRNRFMLGLRYYTDYISKAGYFREEYPGQNLEKARKLLL